VGGEPEGNEQGKGDDFAVNGGKKKASCALCLRAWGGVKGSGCGLAIKVVRSGKWEEKTPGRLWGEKSCIAKRGKRLGDWCGGRRRAELDRAQV